MTLDEFREFMAIVFGPRPENLRLGQHAYAVLLEKCPEAARDVAGTSDDPFYSDDRMPYFLARILTRFVGYRRSKWCRKAVKRGIKNHKRLIFDEKTDEQAADRVDQEPQAGDFTQHQE
jgi:hypothetical protein